MRKFLFLLLLLSAAAWGQGGAGPYPNAIRCIYIQNADNTYAGTLCNPFTFKAGTNLTWSVAGNVVTVNATGGGPGGGYATIQNNGAPITQQTTLNLSTSFLATDDGAGSRTNLAIASGGISNGMLASNYSGVGSLSCTNQVPTSLTLNANSAPTAFGCSTLTSSFTSGTFPATAHNLLSATHGDTTAAAAVRGDMIAALGVTPTWQRVAHSAATGGYWKWNGADVVASTGAASGTGSPTACTNQVVTAFTLSGDSAPTSTCSNVTTSFLPGSGATTVHSATCTLGSTCDPTYTAAQVTNAFDVTTANTLTNVVAPGSPAAGKNAVFSDSTDLRFHDKNASGVIGTTVVADTGAANNFLTAISAAGAISKARPTCSSLSDSGTLCTSAGPLPANTTATTHQFFTAYNSTTGAFTKAQPAAADLSDGTTGSGSVVQATNPTLPSYFDVTEVAAPANPGAGNERWYANSTSHLLSCVTSTGTNCNPSGGATSPGAPVNSVQFNSAGNFAGNAGFTFDATTGNLAAPFANLSGTYTNAVSSYGLDVAPSQTAIGAGGFAVGVGIYPAQALGAGANAGTENVGLDVGPTLTGVSNGGVSAAIHIDNPTNNSTGTLGNFYGLHVDTATNGGGGTISSAAGIKIESWAGKGTASYGLLVADYGAGAGDYAINVVGGKSFFGGPVNLSATQTITKDNLQTTPTDALIAQNTTAATVGVTTQYSPALHIVDAAWKTAGGSSDQHEWRWWGIPTSGATTADKVSWQHQVASGGFTEKFAMKDTGVFDAAAAFTIGGSAATAGKYLKSDGSSGFVASTGSASGVGSCTNQAVTAVNADAAPTCTTITSSYVDTSVAAASTTMTANSVVVGNGTNSLKLSATMTDTEGGPLISGANSLQFGNAATALFATASSNSGLSLTTGGGSTKWTWDLNGAVSHAPAARTSGVASYFTINIPADTGLTAATESIGFQTVTAARTWADGTVALQRENFFAGPTYNKTTTAATFTELATLYLTPPIAGTGVTFTRPHTLAIVDSTSAASAITGGVVVAATLGTAATSVGIGGGNVNAGTAITAPTVVGTTTIKSSSHVDANGNPFLLSSATASAVDSVTITNAATANPATVKIASSGSDTNVNLEFDTLGTGKVGINGTTQIVATTSATLTSGQIVTGAGTQTVGVGNLTGDVTTSGSTATTLAHTYPVALGTTGNLTCTNAGGTANFIGTSGSSATETTGTYVKVIPTEAYTISKMFVNSAVAVPASQTVAVVVMDAASASVTGTAQTVTCSVGAAALACNDTAHTFTTTAGHAIYIRATCSGGTTASTGPWNVTLGIK